MEIFNDEVLAFLQAAERPISEAQGCVQRYCMAADKADYTLDAQRRRIAEIVAVLKTIPGGEAIATAWLGNNRPVGTTP